MKRISTTGAQKIEERLAPPTLVERLCFNNYAEHRTVIAALGVALSATFGSSTPRSEKSERKQQTKRQRT
jgi:hypothetical protein